MNYEAPGARERAPGLNAALLDGLLRDAWSEGFERGYTHGQANGLEIGQQAGRKQGAAQQYEALLGNVWHGLRTCREMAKRLATNPNTRPARAREELGDLEARLATLVNGFHQHNVS